MDKSKRYFKKIHNQLETGFTKAYKEYGLTSTQLDILRYLSENPAGENTLTDIASHFGVKHTSVIHVLKLLEKKGLIRKNPVQGTRAKPILLTDKGGSLTGSDYVCRSIGKRPAASGKNARTDLQESGIRRVPKSAELKCSGTGLPQKLTGIKNIEIRRV